jgi:hypothetical protein
MHVAVWLYAILALASLASLIARRPWTAALARRRMPPAVWTTELFLETNLVLTALWTLLFAGGGVIRGASHPSGARWCTASGSRLSGVSRSASASGTPPADCARWRRPAERTQCPEFTSAATVNQSSVSPDFSP